MKKPSRRHRKVEHTGRVRKPPAAPKTPPEGFIFLHQEDDLRPTDKIYTGARGWVELGDDYKRIRPDARFMECIIREVGFALSPFDMDARYQIVWQHQAETSNRKEAEIAITAYGYTFVELPWDNKDVMVVDHKRKEWAYWELGFEPFGIRLVLAEQVRSQLRTHNLSYWFHQLK